MERLPLGKLSPNLLERILRKIPQTDSTVILGPGTGLDCSVLDFGDQYLVFKSDPISLTSENIGWYAVEINTNDIVTTGADPKWLLTTILLPEGSTSFSDVDRITDQLIESSKRYGITIIGGHTEITSGINRPILSCTMIGTVEKDKLITPNGVKIGDLVFLTKEIAIETVSIIANDLTNELTSILSDQEISTAVAYLKKPGISIFKEATLLRNGFGVTAMHDPTEGSLASALWEMSIASQKEFRINLDAIPLSPLTKKITDHFSINPMNSISSGALLFTANPMYKEKIFSVMSKNSIPVALIGEIKNNGIGVFINEGSNETELQRPERDDITKIF
jgi:hydrogenase maturation factor